MKGNTPPWVFFTFLTKNVTNEGLFLNMIEDVILVSLSFNFEQISHCFGECQNNVNAKWRPTLIVLQKQH